MRRLLTTMAGAGTVTLLAAGTVFGAGTVVQVTEAGGNTDPFAACTVGAGTGFNYSHAEVEPSVSVNPSNPLNIVGVFQQDRWSNGGAHGLASAFSTDGGTTWKVVPLPFSRCQPTTPANLQYERASDPWVSFGPGTPANPNRGATAYTVGLPFNVTNNNSAVSAAVSYNGGQTWVNAQAVQATASFQLSPDKESVTADPRNPGTAYAVWDVIVGPPAASDQAEIRTHSFTGPTFFAKTTDFGRTWSSPVVINDVSNPTPQHNQTIGNVIVVDRQTGELFLFFDAIFGTGSNAGGNPVGAHGDNVGLQTSTDRGSTWSAVRRVSTIESIGVTDPNNPDPRSGKAPAPIRTGDFLPEPAIDPQTGQLYVVFQDSRFSGGVIDEVALITSTDHGATWSAPQRVSTPTGNPAFTPTVAVTDSGTAGMAGTVGVTYFQFAPTSPNSEPTTYFIKEFTAEQVAAGGLEAQAATVVAGPFNMMAAPFARGYFVGDYEGLATAGSSFVPFFVQTKCADLSCAALTSPTNRTPTGRNSTDVFAGSAF